MSMVRVARHGSLRSEVYRRLRDDILQGRYKRGTALTEAQITLSLGVSRTPVREAIGQLELDGLVRTTPNKSIVVQGFDLNDIMDLYEVRRNMETLAAARAAEQMSEDQRQAFQAAFDREVRDTEQNDSIEDLQNLDNVFHEHIFQGSGSKILRNILSPINTYTRYARSVSLASPGRSLKVLEEHARILAAIINRDPQAASQSMRDHIDQAAANFLALSSKGDKTDD
jgi:DNA-binding GntR family transcriptional regulator